MEYAFNKWLKDGIIPEEQMGEAIKMFDRETEQINALADKRMYWEALGQLTTTLALFNATAQQRPTQQPKIIKQLLQWIHNLKDAIDKAIKGIEANGYSIGVSFPWGVSVSVSFSV
jgi:hypothetical protein